MAKGKSSARTEVKGPTAAGEYMVVARRYRPQQFADLIGQEHVASALVNALQSNRVAHAYLFTGARGVGKTSAARILAKALNCVKGPTPTPCDECDSCKAIAVGEDVDVLEIDGASNRGIEDARELRQNIAFRPTRSRFKIYIIDEVHMLTKDAFNALLKTLEEPPEHVKFIFATTEVQKIPITILSRCQRFDFAHIGPAKIFDQLKQIVTREGLEAEDDALKLIARRAGGSMRDSQSLLDQLLSSASGKLTSEQVNAVLGTAGDERVIELAAAILACDPNRALDLIANWVDRGLQIGELVDQLIGYWRSLMLVACGGPEVHELPVSPTQKAALTAQVGQTSLDAILAGLDIWTATRARLRDSPHAQVLLEMAVVRLSRLGDLLSVGELAQALRQTNAGPLGAALPGQKLAGASIEATEVSKKNGRAAEETELTALPAVVEESTLELTESTLRELWQRLIRYLAKRSPIL
ncbi:MAG TPA: DNA polymerase III subunit gamma/tau, partial [Gemmata sp.]|nr:DNA polymerase III subunit gamma/tau [Gemmata sp.]